MVFLDSWRAYGLLGRRFPRDLRRGLVDTCHDSSSASTGVVAGSLIGHRSRLAQRQPLALVVQCIERIELGVRRAVGELRRIPPEARARGARQVSAVPCRNVITRRACWSLDRVTIATALSIRTSGSTRCRTRSAKLKALGVQFQTRRAGSPAASLLLCNIPTGYYERSRSANGGSGNMLAGQLPTLRVDTSRSRTSAEF